jgi:dTDP-4-amino-4,6-dideoxygalactose transaminase
MNVPFLSFAGMHTPIKSELINAFESVYDSHWYIMGNSLKMFEKNYAEFSKTTYCAGVANGLDALTISLKALNISSGDEVIVPSNTYIASWLAVSNVGAIPVPVEPRESTFNINPDLIETAITANTKAIMPVHLFGQSCEMEKIMAIAHKHNLYVVEDNAQSQGSTYKGKLTGSFGNINATSFYPGKNLGALGDAGAITTSDEALFNQVNMIRNYGSQKKYYNEIKGVNSRLDELQAALLDVKLKYLNEWTDARISIATKYNTLLKGVGDIVIPSLAEHIKHVYHLYVIRTNKRDELQDYLNKQGIGTLIHYPIPPHLQKAYSEMNFKKGQFHLAEKIAETSLSIPLYPGLKNDEIEFVAQTIRMFY